VVRRTGHSSYYVEKGMSAAGKMPTQTGVRGEFKVCGGAFPVWLENAPCCPIAVVACYSGSSPEDHHLVANALRDYIKKVEKDSSVAPPQFSMPMVAPPQSGRESFVCLSFSVWSHDSSRKRRSVDVGSGASLTTRTRIQAFKRMVSPQSHSPTPLEAGQVSKLESTHGARKFDVDPAGYRDPHSGPAP